jgi:hypothetical protein
VITSEILEREGCSHGECVVAPVLVVGHFSERVYACDSFRVTSPNSISTSPHYWPWFPLRRGRGRTEARGMPCALGRRLGCTDVEWGFGCSGKGAGCALIFNLYPMSRLIKIVIFCFFFLLYRLHVCCISLFIYPFPMMYPSFGLDSHCILSSRCILTRGLSHYLSIQACRGEDEHFAWLKYISCIS